MNRDMYMLADDNGPFKNGENAGDGSGCIEVHLIFASVCVCLFISLFRFLWWVKNLILLLDPVILSQALSAIH